MPLIKKSHVVYSKFLLMVVKNLWVGGKVSIALAKSRETCVASSLNYDSWSHFRCLSMPFIICNLHNPCLGLFVVSDSSYYCNLLNLVFL